jgi:Cytochrome P460
MTIEMRSASLAGTLLCACACTAPAAAGAPDYNANGELLRPVDYRDWAYVTSGLDMFYGPGAEAAPPPAANEVSRPSVFTNVFVTRPAYEEFMRSGTWPDKTMFILEVRRAEKAQSIDSRGQSQGAVLTIESAVKDVQRFSASDGSNGWGYFGFGSPSGLRGSSAVLPTSASCYSCHAANTAVDNTFVQFYPTLFEVAKRLGTVKTTYDPAHKL